MSAWTYRHSGGKAVHKIVPPRPRIPWWKGLGADSEEKHEPASDIDTAAADSLKVLDPKRPIREADIGQNSIDPFQVCDCPLRGGHERPPLRMANADHDGPLIQDRLGQLI